MGGRDRTDAPPGGAGASTADQGVAGRDTHHDSSYCILERKCILVNSAFNDSKGVCGTLCFLGPGGWTSGTSGQQAGFPRPLLGRQTVTFSPVLTRPCLRARASVCPNVLFSVTLAQGHCDGLVLTHLGRHCHIPGPGSQGLHTGVLGTQFCPRPYATICDADLGAHRAAAAGDTNRCRGHREWRLHAPRAGVGGSGQPNPVTRRELLLTSHLLTEDKAIQRRRPQTAFRAFPRDQERLAGAQRDQRAPSPTKTGDLATQSGRWYRTGPRLWVFCCNHGSRSGDISLPSCHREGSGNKGP